MNSVFLSLDHVLQVKVYIHLVPNGHGFPVLLSILLKPFFCVPSRRERSFVENRPSEQLVMLQLLIIITGQQFRTHPSICRSKSNRRNVVSSTRSQKVRDESSSAVQITSPAGGPSSPHIL